MNPYTNYMNFFCHPYLNDSIISQFAAYLAGCVLFSYYSHHISFPLFLFSYFSSSQLLPLYSLITAVFNLFLQQAKNPHELHCSSSRRTSPAPHHPGHSLFLLPALTGCFPPDLLLSTALLTFPTPVPACRAPLLSLAPGEVCFPRHVPGPALDYTPWCCLGVKSPFSCSCCR